MSLIEEALRRIQRIPESDAGAQATAPQPPSPPTATSPTGAGPSAHPWPATSPPTTPTATSPAVSAIAIMILALTGVFLVGGIFWMGRAVFQGPRAAGSVPRMAQAPDAESGLRTGQPGRFRVFPGTQSAGDPSEPGLILQGLVVGAGESYAMVNGEIVRIGEEVGGGVLTRISDTGVAIRQPDGEEITLRVPR